MGQSAGAHISACALMDQAVKEANGERTSWSVSQIKAYFGLSGGYLITSFLLSCFLFKYLASSDLFLKKIYISRYNLPELVDHFNERGLHKRIFLR
jgi:hypothetical protein